MSDTESNLGFDANQKQGGEQSSNVNSTDESLQSTLNALNKRLDSLEATQRTLQSGKDRGVAQVQKEQQALNAQFAEIKAYLDKYPDPADAERFYQMDQFLANAQQGQPQNLNQVPAEEGVASQQPQVSEETAQILNKLGVKQDSPEFLAKIAQGMSHEQAALALLSADIQGGAEGVASGVSGGSGGSNVSTSQEVLRSQYNQELDAVTAAQGWIPPQVMYNIKEKYARLGLQGLDY